MKCYRKGVSFSDLWVSTNENLSDFYTSSWQRGESPIPMLVIRSVLVAVALAIFVWSLVESPTPYWLMFLTNWGLLLVTTMMLSGLLVSCIACKKSFEGEELPWYMSMYWFFYNISVTIAIMITALYWILLYDPEAKEEMGPRAFWLDVATHGFNSCIAVAELLLSRTPVKLLHMYMPLGLGLWYAAFSGIYYLAGGTDGNGNPYIYEVLDWRQGRRAGTIIAAAMAGLILLYILLWGAALCRDKISTVLVRTSSHDLPVAPPDRHMRMV